MSYTNEDLAVVLNGLYHYAWFVGFGISGGLYWLLNRSLRAAI